ncbi:hypothetical protein QQ045_001086 [Rhodiola kirilowii]
MDFNLFQKVITEEENRALASPPEPTEVYDQIKSMNGDSAPGPDGFSGRFYIKCWGIIRDDFMAAIALFFQGFQLPTSITGTTLTLIPKVETATSIAHLRLISLCNFCHKIISRIITSRLVPILPKLISEEQVGFVQGRCIHDNICLAHDLTHDLHNKHFGGNVIIKLDMAKAYDRVSWRFILAALRAFGFQERFCDLIYRCISNCHYSIKWDGKLYGYFKSFRGVRQGDPLSPSLFVIAMEWLSKSINDAVSRGKIWRDLPRGILNRHLWYT